MSRKLSFCLAIIALTVVVLLFNSRDNLSVNLVVGNIKLLKSLWLLIFTGIGVAVGILLK
jgi:hypothetical protein